MKIFIISLLSSLIINLSYQYNRLDLNLGDQQLLTFTPQNINYFVHFQDFDKSQMKAGLCMYSTSQDSEKRTYQFNNTMYHLHSFNTVQIPFMANQRGMNITLAQFDGEQLQQMDGETVLDQMNVQVCGINNQQQIGYQTLLSSNQVNNIYFFKNNKQQKKDGEYVDYNVSEYNLYTDSFEQGKKYVLSINYINLESKKKNLYPKLVLLQNNQQDGESLNFPQFNDLSNEQMQYLQNVEEQNEQFLYTYIIDCTNSNNNCQSAITIFYNFPDTLGKFKSPYAKIQIQELVDVDYQTYQDGEGMFVPGFQDITDQIMNENEIDGENSYNSVSGIFSSYNQFQYYTFTLSSKYVRIFQKNEASQPEFQLCVLGDGENQDGEQQSFMCRDPEYYIQTKLDKPQKYYMIMTPSKPAKIWSSKIQKYQFTISQGIMQLNNDLTIQRYFGNVNAFSIEKYTNQPYLNLKITFLAIKTNVPETEEFANGYTKNMDQYITFCTEKDVEDCDFYAYKNAQTENMQTITFEGLTPVVGFYAQTVKIPSQTTFIIINQEIYVQPTIGENSNEEPPKYLSYVGEVSETVQPTIQKTLDGKADHTLALILTIVIIFSVVALFVAYCLISRHFEKKKRAKQLAEEQKILLENEQNMQSEQSKNGGQFVDKSTKDMENQRNQYQNNKLNNINNTTQIDSQGNTVIGPSTIVEQ